MSKLIFKHLPRMFGRCKGTFRNIIIFQNQTFFKYFRQRYISLAPPTERSYGVVVVGNVYKLRKLLDIYFVKHVTMSRLQFSIGGHPWWTWWTGFFRVELYSMHLSDLVSTLNFQKARVGKYLWK